MDEEDDISIIYEYCIQCDLDKQPGSNHCELCELCIDEYDHHCPWIGKCIGKGNKFFFNLFLAGLLAVITYTSASLLICIEVFLNKL